MAVHESMSCPVCGGELLPHIVCGNCGTDITLQSVEGLESTYKCPVCGSDAKVKFICEECGSEFPYQLIMKKMSEVEVEIRPKKKPKVEKENLGELETGLTNGLTAKTSTSKRKSKGLTNGKGKGLTNGMGKGLTNGMGKGMTNGLKGGMINGSGVTNGTKPQKSQTKKEKKSALSAVIAAIVAIILVIGALYVLFLPHNAGIQIDGNFSDWNGTPMREEFYSAVHPLDMVRYASKLSNGYLYIYLQGKGNLFSTHGSRIYAFVDADDNLATGYRINGIGADYLCKIYGENGKITAHGLYKYSSSGNGLTWTWVGYGGLMVAYRDNKLEMGFIPDSINENYRITFYTSDSKGNHEISSVNIGESPSLYFEEKRYGPDVYPMNSTGQEQHLMDIGVFATGGNVTLRYISLEASGFSDVTLKDSVGNMISTLTNGVLTINKKLDSNERATYEIWGIPSSSEEGSLLSVNINDVYVSPANVILTEKIEPFRAYLGQPSSIKIDGAFGDWKTTIEDEDSERSPPAHIDIERYSAVNDTKDLYFYIKVNGEMMAGVLVPERYYEGLPTQNVSIIPRTVTGEDILRVHVNTDNGKYYIEVLGKEGKIISTSLYRWDGSTWRQISVPEDDLKTAKDFSRMEGGIPLGLLGNPSHIRIWFEMSDWEGNRDLTKGMDSMSIEENSGMGRSTDDVSPVPEFQNYMVPVLFTVGIAIAVIRRRP